MTTILGMGEPGNVRTPQIRYFYPLCPEGHGIPNYVDVFVRRCQEIQGESRGNISMGGMVTLLALAVGEELTAEDIQISPHTATSLDELTLTQIGFISHSRGLFDEVHLLVNRVKTTPLPPFPPHLFHINPHHSTSDCVDILQGMFDIGVDHPGPEVPEEEMGEGNEESDEDYAPFIDVAQRNFHAGASSSHQPPDEGAWRSYMEQRFDTLTAEVQGLRSDMAQGFASMQAQMEANFARLFSQGYHQPPPPPPHDPWLQAYEEQQERLRRQRRDRGPYG